jgi:hypothetical protein
MGQEDIGMGGRELNREKEIGEQRGRKKDLG